MISGSGDCLSRPLQAVLVPTETIPDTPVICGHDFSKACDVDSIMSSMLTSGFQATALGQAIIEVNRMVSIGAACSSWLHWLVTCSIACLTA